MTQHTPGPWRSYSSGCARVVYGKDSIGADRRIAEMIGRDDEANARLIAAAPTMLEALQKTLAAIKQREAEGDLLWTTPGETAGETLRNAIEDATGTRPE